MFRSFAGSKRGEADESGPPKALTVASIFAGFSVKGFPKNQQK
jgi:hypothetical protein